MKTETFDNPAEFMRALKGGSSGRGKSTGRVPRGDGDRVPDLMKLAARGWIRTNCQDGLHWMTRQDGTDGPRVSSYRAMLDTMLMEVTQ